MKQLLFVVGLPRSGTSLLYSILNQHPQIALMYEADFLSLRQISLATKFRTNWLTRIEFWNGALGRHGIEITPEFCETITEPRSLYLAYAARKEATVYGEKSPNYGMSLRRLSKSFPDARFIIIRRDFASIYRSVLGAGDSAPHFRRRGMLPRLLCKQEKLLRDTLWLWYHRVSVLSVHYRDLVADTGQVARDMCEFLDLPFDERMQTLAGADLSAVYRDQIHEHLRGREIRERPAALQLDSDVENRIACWENYWRRIWGGPIDEPQPSLTEKIGVRAVGTLIFFWFAMVRVLFEFLPLSVLRFYRAVKSSLAGHDVNVPETAELASLARIRDSKHPKLATAFPAALILLLLGVFGLADYYVGPFVTLAPFYLIPPALALWNYNFRFGIVASFLSAVVWTFSKMHDIDLHHLPMILLWNAMMRFTLLTAFLLVFSQWVMRKAAMTQESKINGPLPELPISYPASLGLLLLGFVGLMDYYTGPFVTLAPFYLIPLALAARKHNLKFGILLCFLSAVVWTFSQTADAPHLSPIILGWNLAMRFLLLAAFVVVFSQWLLRQAAMRQKPEINGGLADSVMQYEALSMYASLSN